ncbi:rod shape-determining protein MreD [Wenzhouxiangella marina]|uniref:Rod shape-determining protein MreD n=1 Tax=Wenzhouxiangella marina TaxID=1579979 RepID=A0A0K0XSL6_9GAMM|nr:rod shape-determining protein MreD [Wenzhouxiangella marina]AKS40617.1 Rod shape-determining protein [Wenzhouxiangella marina]MBB6088385.1 rod shape-determining protein MreD [Wenzhouxiangella marina]
MSFRNQGQSLFVLSLAMAFALTLLPLPVVLEPLRPYWVALVILYWNLEGGRLRHLGQGFLIGVFLDLLTGSLLGQHALGLVVLMFLLERFRARIRFFPPWQQAAAVLALLFNDRVIHSWVIALQGNDWPPWSWWLAPVVGVLIWPWLFLLLDALRRRQRVHHS